LDLLQNRALDQPKLRVGATNILEGYTKPIVVEDYGPHDLHRILLASASIPPLFPATVLHGAYFWDGLYSHNPPIDCLTNPKPLADEIWVIQINPDSRLTPPKNAAELVDRRNELMGNLSLAAELYHIDAMNWLIEKSPAALKTAGYKKIMLRVVQLREDLDLASKYDRSRSQIEFLMNAGERSAHEFFEPQSLWTNPAEGVHTAIVDPTRTGKPQAGHAAQSALPFCSMVCPGCVLCNTCPLVTRLAEESFDFGQKHFEA